MREVTGWQVLGWAGIAAIVIVVDGLAVAFATIFIQSARNTSKPSNPYRSRSHE